MAGGSSGGAASTIPTLVASIVTAQKEGQGTQDVVTTLSVGTPGLALVSIDAVRTALFAGPPTLNNGNTFSGPIVTEAYTPGYPQYSLRVFKAAAVMGSAPHSSTMRKVNSFAEEATKALFAFSSGDVVAQSSVVRNPAGVNALLTSAPITITQGSARCLAIWSGSGDINPTAPTATNTDPSIWGTPIVSIAYSSATAPSGHIPLIVWTGELPLGTHTWAARPAINEGAIMATVCVR